MSNINKNLGHVTAYGYYKAGGGTMTEEEFTQFMVDFGTAAQTAVNAANNAEQSETAAANSATAANSSKNAAESSATAAASSATSASGSATTASTKASEAATSATNASNSESAAASSATTANNAKIAAQSAQTAAETAQTAAETAQTAAETAKTNAETAATTAQTAANSVSSSASQIAQNTSDISQLNSDISDLNADLTRKITPVYPSSLILDKSNYKMTDIKSVKKKITSTATWQSDTFIIFQNIAIEENQELLVHFDGRSIDGASSTNLAVYMFYDVDGAQIGSSRYIKYSNIDSVSGACDFHDIAPTGSKKVSVTIYGISNVAPTIGNTCYINNACLFIGVAGFKSTNMIYNKLNLNMDWVHGGIWSGNVVNVKYRICTKNIVNVPVDFVIDIKSGYKYGVVRYNNSGVQISDTGWLTTKHSIYAGERVGISIAKASESTAEWADLDTFINAITFYPVANVNDSPQYYYYGEKIETKKHAISVSDLGVTRVNPADTSLVAQGGAVYGGKLFQVYKENYMQIYDIATNTLESSFAITCGHGDCVSFSNEFYDAGDTYPLIYITSDETPSSVYVNRINNGSATLIRKLVFPQSAGYYGGHALDADNNIIYLISYSEQDYRTASNNNHMIVTAWDLSSLTDNGDSTYTPQLLDTFELPFIYVCQDQEFYNGRIYILSSFLASEAPSKVVIINPYAHTISNTITNLPTSITDTEDEVITFMQDNSGVWHMVIGKHTAYYKLSFA